MSNDLDSSASDIIIDIELDEAEEIIKLRFKTSDRSIVIGFNIQEAQILSIMLHEKITEFIIKKMKLPDLFPPTPENIH